MWFRRRGVRIRRLLTDNAMAYRARAFCGVSHLGGRQRYTRPYRPQTNGKAERFIQTLLREWGSGTVSQLGAADRRARPVPPLLQPPASTREPRSALAVDAFPRGCLMNNLFDIHS